MTFRGGYNFKHFEGSAEPVLREMPVPEKILLPLSTSHFKSFLPLVKEGKKIRAGDTILESKKGTKISFVSPVNGTVSKITKKEIIIVSDGSASFKPVAGHTREPWHLERSEVFSLFCSTGCSFLFNNRFDSLKKCDSIKHIIINAVHNSPLNQSWIPEIFCDSRVFLNGLRTLKALFSEAVIVIAINKRNKKYFDTSDIKNTQKSWSCQTVILRNILNFFAGIL